MLLRRSKILVALLLVACGCNCQPSTPGAGPKAPTAQAADPSSAEPAAAAKPAAPKRDLPGIPEADPREGFIAAAISRMLETQHLSAHNIDDDVSKQAFEFFVERLDPAKLFLLESDVDALRDSALELDDQIHEGDLRLARLGAAMVAERRAQVAKMVAELLSQPFDFTREEFFETDVEKRSFASTEQELRDLWRGNLKRQTLERMAEMRETLAASTDEEAPKEGEGKGSAEGDEGESEGAKPAAGFEPPPATEEGREKKAREDLAATYSGRFARLADTTSLDAAELFLNAVAAAFDPHTLYLAPDDKANFDIQMTGSLEGIGAVLREGDHYIEVNEVVPGGAAWRQGDLEAGDLILAVMQEGEKPVDVADMRINEVVRMIRGPKGTVVTLQVRKPDGRLTSIVITRDEVNVEATYARGAVLDLGKGKAPVGYVFLPGFYGDTRRGSSEGRNATDDVRALLERFRKRKLEGVILDLRGNGGGLLNHATAISGLFIEEGPVVQVHAPALGSEVLADEDPEIVYSGKLVVLVDRFSASASEILAGALQDYHRALIVGTGPTHGKGTVQMVVDLNRLMRGQGPPFGVLKLTVQQFFLVDGESTQQRGVQPDIVLPDPMAFVESGERHLQNPIPWSKRDPLEHEPWSPEWSVAALEKHSLARRDKDPSFARVQARSAFLDARSKETRVPLEKGAWQQRRDDEKKALDALDPELEKEKARFAVKLVPYRPEATPQSGGKRDARKAVQERIDKWSEKLAHDPWVAESAQLLQDM